MDTVVGIRSFLIRSASIGLSVCLSACVYYVERPTGYDRGSHREGSYSRTYVRGSYGYYDPHYDPYYDYYRYYGYPGYHGRPYYGTPAPDEPRPDDPPADPGPPPDVSGVEPARTPVTPREVHRRRRLPEPEVRPPPARRDERRDDPPS